MRAVIRGAEPGTTLEELTANLRVRTQGVTLHSTRTLRATEATVYHLRARQACQVCLQSGHRSDACPTPNARVCRQCGTLDHIDGHPCAPKCRLCGNGHITAAKACSQRLKAPRREHGHLLDSQQPPLRWGAMNHATYPLPNAGASAKTTRLREAILLRGRSPSLPSLLRDLITSSSSTNPPSNSPRGPPACLLTSQTVLLQRAPVTW
ncbi:hypothetical protein HPB52_025216 [Rhipicephalus sanguineus]|uniref:Uncharacterized protein n=1 Tax=Rhipicephalus sanguineus TaxID=34632 RepID=A0A9D4YRK9_RHISA|nr:hypothetical protein HPB52_025388 [Rhipicephalus sanguineus]KAH7986089.1 hypothetical protein HPB52_025216 [Rhipicephalus sanguineus]